jgi:hypothetical protein
MAPQPKLHAAAGQRFGRGTVLDPEIRVPRADRPGRGERGARLRCDCGTIYDALLSHLLAGNVLSCGCQRRDRASERLRQARGYEGGYQLPPTNGLGNHPLYHVWRGMLDRCENHRNNRYHRYGARGIKVCERWHDIALFVQDIEREIGVKPARCPECGGRYSLDRINNDRGYEPGNVRWATASEQNSNKKNL